MLLAYSLIFGLYFYIWCRVAGKNNFHIVSICLEVMSANKNWTLRWKDYAATDKIVVNLNKNYYIYQLKPPNAQSF